jgi:hypothetical protein
VGILKVGRANYVVAIFIAALVTVAYYWWQSWQALGVATDCVFVLASGFCSLLAFLVVRRWGYRGKLGAVQFGLFVGIFFWFLGDLSWTVYETVLRVSIPYPSFADVFYLGAYIPIAVGLILFLRTFWSGIDRKMFIVGLCLGLFFFVLTCVVLIGPLVMSSEDLLTKFFDVAYPVADSILIVLSILVLVNFKGGKIAAPWIWICLGLFLAGLYDITFGLGTLQGWYYSGNPIELIQLYGYVCLGLGFYEQRGVLST